MRWLGLLALLCLPFGATAFDVGLLRSDCHNHDGRHEAALQAAYCIVLAETTEDRDEAVMATIEAARQMHNSNRPEAGIGILDDLLSEDPGLADAWKTRGLIQMAYEDFGNAIASFTKMIEAAPEDPEGYSHRASIYTVLGRYQSGLADYGRALEVDPDNELALAGRAALFHDTEDYQNALADYDRLIRIAPDKAQYHLLRGHSNQGVSQFWEAIKDYNRSIDLEEKNPEAYANLGIIALMLDPDDDEKNKVAQVMLERAAEYDPDDATTQMHLGRAEARLGNVREALRAYLLANALNPEMIVLYKGSLNARGYYDGVIDGTPDDAVWFGILKCIKENCGFMEAIGE